MKITTPTRIKLVRLRAALQDRGPMSAAQLSGILHVHKTTVLSYLRRMSGDVRISGWQDHVRGGARTPLYALAEGRQ